MCVCVCVHGPKLLIANKLYSQSSQPLNHSKVDKVGKSLPKNTQS